MEEIAVFTSTGLPRRPGRRSFNEAVGLERSLVAEVVCVCPRGAGRDEALSEGGSVAKLISFNSIRRPSKAHSTN